MWPAQLLNDDSGGRGPSANDPRLGGLRARARARAKQEAGPALHLAPRA